MNKGRNASSVRIHNQKAIIEMLSDEPFSCNEIAKKLKLCNSAVEKIVDELSRYNIICIDDTNREKSVGRAPIYYKLNGNYGYVVCVDFSQSYFEITRINGEIIGAATFLEGMTLKDGHLYDLDSFIAIIGIIKNQIAKSKLDTASLKAIALAAPGRANPDTGEIIKAASIKDFKNINLKKLFGAHFAGVPVLIRNDVEAASIAEQKFGLLKNNDGNAIYIKIDEGISISTFFGGKIVQGKEYLSGEIGYNRLYSPLHGGEVRLHDLVTTYSLCKLVNKGKKDWLSIDEIIRLYKAGQADIKKTVDCAAAVLGTAIMNLYHVLDCNIAVIAGYVTSLGEPYLKIIADKVKNFNSGGEIRFSHLQGSIEKGIRSLAINQAILHKLYEERN
jgi:glucokinase